MTFELRSAASSDWQAILTVAMKALPDAALECREWWENRKSIDPASQRRVHRVAENDRGEVVGYGALEEGPEDGFFRLFIVADPKIVARGLGELLYKWLIGELNRMGAEIAWIREEVRDPIVAFFKARGFEERNRFTLENGREAIVLFHDFKTPPVS